MIEIEVKEFEFLFIHRNDIWIKTKRISKLKSQLNKMNHID